MPKNNKSKARKFKRAMKMPKTALIKKVNRIIRGIEKKHFDTSSTQSFANDSNPFKLSCMAEGTTSLQRSGLKVTAQSIVIRGQIQWPLVVGQETAVRLMIFYDKNPEGALPAITDVLESGAISSLYNNKTIGKRFIVIHDKLYNNNDVSTTINKETAVRVVKNVKKQVHYIGTGSANADLGANNLFMLTVGDATTASANSPSFLVKTRFWYTDL